MLDARVADLRRRLPLPAERHLSEPETERAGEREEADRHDRQRGHQLDGGEAGLAVGRRGEGFHASPGKRLFTCGYRPFSRET
jgi:hypothetical protein